VIHYGIEPERFAGTNFCLRQNWFSDGTAVIGSIGRLEPRKGHDCLIRAMPATLEHAPNACLVIAGHDPWKYGKHLQTLIEQLRLQEKVRLAGFQADVASFLSGLDVFALASRSEGFGQVVIEAMAAGKPVVVNKIPPLTEIVADDETGILVDPEKPAAFARAISRLLANADEARQMGRRGRERVQSHFSAEKMATNTTLLYDELVGTRSVERLLG
jgi:glycosyltransferase involved in cell wall biosynthesis